MKGIPEWFPILGEKKDVAPAPTQSGPTTPFSATSMPPAEVNPTVTTTAAPEAGASMPTPEPATMTPELTNVGTTSMEETVGTTPVPVGVENVSASVDQTQNTGLGDSARDTAVGMAAMTNAFPGTVMQPPQEAATPTPIEDKPAA